MLGAIDGSHIMLPKRQTKDHTPIDEFYELYFHSTLLQGVCGHQHNFFHICVNALGGEYDASQIYGGKLRIMKGREFMHVYLHIHY